VKALLADALFGTQPFLDEASRRCGGTQVISQLRGNQNLRFRGQDRTVAEYFRASPGISQRLRIRGGETIDADINSARVHGCAQGKKPVSQDDLPDGS